MNRKWTVEHINQHRIMPRAVNGIDCADRFQGHCRLPLLSIVPVEDSQSHTAALKECRRCGRSVTLLDNAFDSIFSLGALLLRVFSFELIGFVLGVHLAGAL